VIFVKGGWVAKDVYLPKKKMTEEKKKGAQYRREKGLNSEIDRVRGGALGEAKEAKASRISAAGGGGQAQERCGARAGEAPILTKREVMFGKRIGLGTTWTMGRATTPGRCEDKGAKKPETQNDLEGNGGVKK